MKKFIEKLFFNTEITWKRLSVLAVVCGIVPGVLMIPSRFLGTSLRQPGTSFEFWIFAAMFIILNSKKPFEAGLKTFVFFLISQPIIYLVQVPFAALGWSLFQYYPRWGVYTVLSFPGAMLAWYVKKNNILSVLILSVANGLLAFELVDFSRVLIKDFPRLLIAVLFIIGQMVLFVLLLFKDKKLKALSFAIIILHILFFSWRAHSSDVSLKNTVTVELEGKAPFETDYDSDSPKVTIDGNILTIEAEFYCDFPIDITDADGNSFTINFYYNESSSGWTRTEN